MTKPLLAPSTYDFGDELVAGEIVDVAGLAALAEEIARQQPAPLTRHTYTGVYKAFCEFVGPGAALDAMTPQRVRAYRDRLEASGRSPATIAKHLSALRTLASALQVEGVRDVRGAKVARGQPRALTAQQYTRLLRMPDRRTTAGKRDLALLHLLGTAGLRRAEACTLIVADVDERRRAGDGRLRQAIAHSSAWWVTVRYAKRGRTRKSRLSTTRSTRSPPGSVCAPPAPTVNCSSRCHALVVSPSH